MQYISGLAIDFAGASSYYAQFLAGWQVVTDSLHQIHPILLILAVIVLTLLAQGLIIFLATRHRRKVNNRTISSYVQQFVEERSKSEAILADLDIGVIAYSYDGQLINANPAARTMFQPHGVPDRLNEFFDRYGQNNGLQAARLLGRDDIVVQVVLFRKDPARPTQGIAI